VWIRDSGALVRDVSPSNFSGVQEFWEEESVGPPDGGDPAIQREPGVDAYSRIFSRACFTALYLYVFIAMRAFLG
jgi:hypothetical protein